MDQPSVTLSDPKEVLQVGTIIEQAGFFTKLHFLGNVRDGVQLERRIGYAPGRLRWTLLVGQWDRET